MSRFALSLSAILLSTTASADVPNVAVDIAPVHSLVARVMDGVGTPNLVIPAGASPHAYNLRPSEAAALQEADLVFWIGEDLTPWLEDAVGTLAAGATVTTLLETDGTVLHDFREGALFEAHDHGDHDDHDDHGHDDHKEAKAEGEDHDHEGHDHDDHDDHNEAKAEEHDHDHDDHAKEEGHDDHDHAEEDGHDDHDHDHAEAKDHDDHGHEDHAEGHDDHDDHDEHAGHDHGDHDPHAWLSPANAATWLNVIAAQLSAADPDNAGAYFANAAAGRTELDALTADVNGILDPVRGKSFVVFHDAYQYFELDFDFPASGAISLGDASDPSPARIAEIQDRIKDEGINCVLAEPQYNPGIVATVMEGTAANTGVIDPLGAELTPGADLYPQLIRNMAQTLADCL